jgi:hypothetical protein
LNAALSLLLVLSQDPSPDLPACRRAEKTAIPPADPPDLTITAGLAGCRSVALYYGMGVPADPVRARQCAYLEREAGDKLVFGGSGLLATIYANGVGATRNFDLAIRFACHGPAAQWDLEERINHLQDLKKRRWQGKNFHLCDDSVGGAMAEHCATFEEEKKQAARDAKVTALTRSWSEADRAAFAWLKSTAGAFIDAHVTDEMDHNGAGHLAAESEERARFDRSLARLLESVETRHAVPGPVHSFIEVNARLERAYRHLPARRKRDRGYAETVTPAAIARTQRQWFAYRDAWIALARQRYPRLTDAISAWVTNDRLEMLRKLTD